MSGQAAEQGIKRLFRPDHPVQFVLGLAIWSLWFVVMYAALSVGCEFFPPVTETVFNLITVSLLLFTLLIMLLFTVLALRNWRYSRHAQSLSHMQRFTVRVGLVLHLLAALATLAGAVPVLVLSPCV